MAQRPGRQRSSATPIIAKGIVYPLQNLRASKLATHGFASKSDTHHMMTSQFRSGRGKTRKREISRDFSRFFDPAFFRSFIDPFCPFRCCVRTRTHEKGFLRLPESNRLCGWIRTCESGAGQCEKAAASQIVYKHIWSLLKLFGFELTKLGNRQSDIFLSCNR